MPSFLAALWRKPAVADKTPSLHTQLWPFPLLHCHVFFFILFPPTQLHFATVSHDESACTASCMFCVFLRVLVKTSSSSFLRHSMNLQGPQRAHIAPYAPWNVIKAVPIFPFLFLSFLCSLAGFLFYFCFGFHFPFPVRTTRVTSHHTRRAKRCPGKEIAPGPFCFAPPFSFLFFCRFPASWLCYRMGSASSDSQKTTLLYLSLPTLLLDVQKRTMEKRAPYAHHHR